MADLNENIKAANLFNVNGLVAVVTGGGSGEFPFVPTVLEDFHFPFSHDQVSAA